MTTLIIVIAALIIALTLAIIYAYFVTIEWLQAEKKLLRFNQSTIYKKNNTRNT